MIYKFQIGDLVYVLEKPEWYGIVYKLAKHEYDYTFVENIKTESDFNIIYVKWLNYDGGSLYKFFGAKYFGLLA